MSARRKVTSVMSTLNVQTQSAAMTANASQDTLETVFPVLVKQYPHQLIATCL